MGWPQVAATNCTLAQNVWLGNLGLLAQTTSHRCCHPLCSVHRGCSHHCLCNVHRGGGGAKIAPVLRVHESTDVVATCVGDTRIEAARTEATRIEATRT